MKTAISLPDALYEKAEETARYMGVSRSRLYALALEEFLEIHNSRMIIEKINKVYENIDQSEFLPHLNARLDQLRDLTKNDSW